jgi:hypothetical protein
MREKAMNSDAVSGICVNQHKVTAAVFTRSMAAIANASTSHTASINFTAETSSVIERTVATKATAAARAIPTEALVTTSTGTPVDIARLECFTTNLMSLE